MKATRAESDPLFLESPEVTPVSEVRPEGPLTPRHFVLDQVPEELFVPSGEEELGPHAPIGLTNPFWDA